MTTALRSWWMPLGLALLSLVLTPPAAGAKPRRVTFPPAEAPPPPPAKAPPRTQASGEETDIIIDPGPTMRKTQHRSPPPPTNLTVMYKVEYGSVLEYKHPDGRVQKFEQWKSFPNDGSNLITLTNQRLKDGNNYQYATKPLSSPGFDPVDIPILYMAGDYDFVLKPAEVKNLRRFLTGGGTILFNAARGRSEFSRAVIREMRRVFPQKAFMRLPLDHPLFNARYRIKQVNLMVNGVQATRPPEVYSIDIGTRATAILVPGGLGSAWSDTPYHPDGKHIIGESAKRLGVNLIAYTLGCTEYGRFLAQEFPLYAGQTRPGDVFRFAQVRYRGSWDVNPALQNSLLQGLRDNTGIGVDYRPHTVALDDTRAGHFPLLFMTGHYDFRLTDAEAAGLARYVRRGGMLVATAAAGLKPFDRAFRRELKKAFPKGELLKLPPTHPLFVGGWNAVERVTYTAAALRDRPTLEYPEFYGLFQDGRLAVLYTPYDLMSGVNRESNAYAKGVAGDDALRLVINAITYALSH
jgi:pimeloyl-ACP methyl ester carboxylesterase